MKKYSAAVIILAVLLLLSACGIRKIGENKTDAPETAKQTAAATETQSEKVTDESEAEGTTSVENAAEKYPAGLYNMISSDATETYEIVSTFNDDMSLGRDLCVLGGFPSTEATLSGADMGGIWNACLSAAALHDTVRPGYLLEFDTPDGKCEKLILRPSDITDAYWDYIETYIYDDIHQTPGEWYSHLLEEEFTDETIVTSVKITAGEKIGEVSDLKLTIFMYDIAERDQVDTDYARANGYTAQIVPNSGR